jgi:hypothetical protein
MYDYTTNWKKKPKKEPEKTSADVIFGKWVYCAQHLAAHRTGWCSVDNGEKLGLGDFPGDEREQGVAAFQKCRRLGLKIYEG